MFLARSAVLERGHKGFANKQTLPGAHEAPRNPLFCCEPSPKIVSISMPSSIHHAAGLGEGGFHRVEFDFDELHVIAEYLVVYFVHCIHRSSDSIKRFTVRGDYNSSGLYKLTGVRRPSRRTV